VAESVLFPTNGQAVRIPRPDPQDRYYVLVEPGLYQLIEVPVVDPALCALNPPNLLLPKRPARIQVYKHGAATPGMLFLFLVPRSVMRVVLEPGYSWPIVLIAGLEVRFNVTGGSVLKDPGAWGDFVYLYASLALVHSRKVIEHIAAVAIAPQSASPEGITLSIPDEEKQRLRASLQKAPSLFAELLCSNERWANPREQEVTGE
jgi:hypothetical protein